MKLKFKDVLPNPYRDLKGNPLLKEKVAELVDSIKTTGFWDNVVVRKNADKKYELAYGHHRIAAALEAGLAEADFIVKDLTDALMIQIMDNENREIYASSPASLIESVKAVVAALATGSIPPFEIDPKTNAQYTRYAPSYVPGDAGPNESRIPYTTLNIAKFLGRLRTKDKADKSIVAALDYLHLCEKGYLTSSVLNGKDRTGEMRPITTSELQKITSEVTETVVKVEERRNKSAEEIKAFNQQQLELQRKMKADAERAEAERNTLLKKAADARLEENNRKADALAKEIKEKDEREKAKAVLNKVAMKALEAKLAEKQALEAAQRVKDAYLPIRRDVESLIGKFEMMVSERNPLREDIKALAKLKELSPKDRQRLRTAAADVGDWFSSWAASQFAPLPTTKKMLAELVKKEKAQRRSNEDQS